MTGSAVRAAPSGSEPVGVIVAGGRATRMGPLGNDTPKALLEVGGRPLLGRQLDVLASGGVRRAFVLAGHLAGDVAAALGQLTPWGIEVDLRVEEEPLGTGGCLAAAELPETTLIVAYGDIVFDLDLGLLLRSHLGTGAIATLVVHPNDHPHDSDLVELDAEGRVVELHCKPHPEGLRVRNLVNAGLCVLERVVIDAIAPGERCDLIYDVVAPLARAGEAVYAYPTTEYLKDIGTPDRYEHVADDWTRGHVRARHRSQRRPVAFLDRDGTLIRQDGYLTDPTQVELLPGAGEAVAALNRAGVLVVVVTNQPQVAHGLIDEARLGTIHAVLDVELGRRGAFLDAIYYCPHHPDRGSVGEIGDPKADCDCRKPGIGLIEQAMADLPIDPSRAVLFGDTWRDEEAATRSGLPFVAVDDDHPLIDGVNRFLRSPVIGSYQEEIARRSASSH